MGRFGCLGSVTWLRRRELSKSIVIYFLLLSVMNYIFIEAKILSNVGLA